MTEINIGIPTKEGDLIIPFTNQELLPFIEKHRKVINDHVVEQLVDKDGGPHLSDTDGTGGSFRLHFKIDRQFCCSDILSCQMDYIDFKFNKSNDTITLTGSYTVWSIQ